MSEQQHRQPVRTLATSFVALVLAGWSVSCLLVTWVRWRGPDGHRAVLLASFAPYAAAAYAVLTLVLLVVVLRSRRRVAAGLALVVAGLGLAVHTAWLAPGFVADAAPADGDEVVVATLNQRLGEAGTDGVVRWLEGHDADVVVLTETTPASLARLEADPRVGSEGEGRWPFRAGEARPGASGTVVLSRHELGPVTQVPVGNGGFRMTVASSTPFTLTAAHAAYPLVSELPWLRDLRVLRDDVAEVRAAGTAGAHVVVGDLNATLDHRQLREVLDAGVRDAAEQAGSGWQPTWPTRGEATAVGVTSPFPALAIDHVLVSDGAVATSTTTAVVPGTDHLGLVARLTLVRDRSGGGA